MEKFTTIQSPHDIGLLPFIQRSPMQPPKLEKIETGNTAWRLTVAGMTRDYRHEWQAKDHYRLACQFYLAKRFMH